MANENNDLQIRVKLGVDGKEDVASAKQQVQEFGETAEMSSHSFKRLAHAVGSEIPGAAQLMEAGFESSTQPMVGATFLLLAGVEMLKAAIEKLNREREQSVRSSEALADADKQTTKGMDAQREALEKAEVAEAIFHHNFIRNTTNAIDAAENLAAAMLKTATATGDDAASTRKGIAEKEIDAMEQRGVVSHATALKMKEQLDLEYEQQKMIRQLALDKMEEMGLKRQLTAKQSAAHDDEAAQRKIADAQGVINGLRLTGINEGNIQQLKDSYGKVSGMATEGPGAASLSEMFTYLSRHAGGIAPRTLFGSYGDVNLATYEGAQLDITGAKSDLARARRSAPGLDIAEGTAKSDLNFARQKMEKDRDAVRTLQEKITETTATNTLKEAGATNAFGMDRANASLSADRDTADRVMAGGPVGNVESQRLMADASRIAGHQVNLQTAAQIIENGANNMGIFMNQVGKLAQAMSSLNPNQLAQMQQQIDQLSRQIGEQSTTGHH